MTSNGKAKSDELIKKLAGSKKTYFQVERVNFTNGWIGAGLVVEKEKKVARIGYRIAKNNELQYWLDMSRDEAYALIKCLVVALAADEQVKDKNELFEKIVGAPSPIADNDKQGQEKPKVVTEKEEHGTGK